MTPTSCSSVAAAASTAVAAIAEIGAGDLERLDKTLGALMPFDVCNSKDALLVAVPPPEAPEVERLVADLQRRLDGLEVQRFSAPTEVLAPEGAALLDEARALRYPPILARAMRLHGLLRREAGIETEACDALRESYAIADEAGDDETAAVSAIGLITVLCGKRGPDRAEHTALWRRLAMSKLQRAGLLGTEAHVALLSARAEEAQTRGALDEARRIRSEALELLEKQLDPSPSRIVQIRAFLAYHANLSAEGADRVNTLLAPALQLCESEIDPDALECIFARFVAALVQEDDVTDRMLHRLRQLLVVLDQHDDPFSLDLRFQTLMKVGVVSSLLGEPERGLEYFERAQGLLDAKRVSDTPNYRVILGVHRSRAYLLLANHSESYKVAKLTLDSVGSEDMAPTSLAIAQLRTLLAIASDGLGRHDEAAMHREAVEAGIAALAHQDLALLSGTINFCLDEYRMAGELDGLEAAADGFVRALQEIPDLPPDQLRQAQRHLNRARAPRPAPGRGRSP